jgi:hypothetical protein
LQLTLTRRIEETSVVGANRSPEAQALHDGFDRHLMPVLAPLGFVRQPTPPGRRSVGWTAVEAVCDLPSGEQLIAQVSTHRLHHTRFALMTSTQSLEFFLSQRDPAWPKQTTLSHAMSHFFTTGDRGEDRIDRLNVALEFLAAELASISDHLIARVPELAPRVEAARLTPAWQGAAQRARDLWTNRGVRSESVDRPVPGKFTFVGVALAVVEADGKRFTFRFDTSRIDRSSTPIISGWWMTPARTQQPSTLTVGATTWHFDSRGDLVDTKRM